MIYSCGRASPGHHSFIDSFIHLNLSSRHSMRIPYVQGNANNNNGKNSKQARSKWVQQHSRKGGATEESAGLPRANGVASSNPNGSTSTSAAEEPKKKQSQQHQPQQQPPKGAKKVNAAAQLRQQQALSAQRGQSILGSAAAIGRFSNSIPTASPASSSSLSEGVSSASSSATKMDMATFQRFSNIGERLAKARVANTATTNGQQGRQQNHHQQPQRRGGGGGGRTNNSSKALLVSCIHPSSYHH